MGFIAVGKIPKTAIIIAPTLQLLRTQKAQNRHIAITIRTAGLKMVKAKPHD